MASRENSGGDQGGGAPEQRSPFQGDLAPVQQGTQASDSNSGLMNNSFLQGAMPGTNDTQQQQLILQQAIQASLQSFINASMATNPLRISNMSAPPLPIAVPQLQQINTQQFQQPQSHSNLIENAQHDSGLVLQNQEPHPPSQISFSSYPMFQTAHPILSTNSSITSRETSRKRKAAESIPHKAWSIDDSTPRSMDKDELDRLSPSSKRRYERNLKEQQRSHQISQQIKQLRDVLTEANVPFKSNKFSILVSVSEYIQQLQSQAIMLDADYQRLVQTIRQTQEASVAGDDVLAPSSVSAAAISSEESQSRSSNMGQKDLYYSYNCPSLNGDELLTQSIDYEQIFLHCPYPWALASLDGRLLCCNPKFAESVGATNHAHLVQQSLFLFIQNHQEIFEAMADLLKRSKFFADSEEESIQEPQLLFWCGSLISTQDQRLDVNITLAPLEDGNPGYFNLSVSTVG
ncbi:hypothetical protein FisN_15Lh105 [Fistulifera solaris]|uniref:BHLH domain-containing protein n=1 Tax=Fistulifera solaris TaxID=1519565 RepID=A0A1Z5KAW5_FISSO|nr:hypothetical protein FisN_15Lh105 [Fistulifera solaris]|eukprot:GAX23387.1 hypothetical protein FisN_15Lh105 [Fistulifera solaris]